MRESMKIFIIFFKKKKHKNILKILIWFNKKILTIKIESKFESKKGKKIDRQEVKEASESHLRIPQSAVVGPFP
jgi:hypothetical protein